MREKLGTSLVTTKTPREFYTEMGVGWLSERKTSVMTENELAYLTGLLKKGWKILDLACGYGRFSIPLAAMGYRVDGIDITPVFIEKAREEAEKKHLHIEFRVGDMQSLPYEDNSFDSVICMWNAFSEIAQNQDQERAIAEIFRVLRRGGLAIIEVRNHRSGGLFEDNFIDGHRAMPSYKHTRGSMKRLMKLLGVDNFKIFIDNFGGRNRLLCEIMKT